jgi:hypothetical protein
LAADYLVNHHFSYSVHFFFCHLCSLVFVRG